MNAIMTSRQAAELDHAFERNGFTSKDVKKLSSGDNLSTILGVLNGTHEIVRKKHIFDLAAPPKPPFHGAEVVKHITEINGESVSEIELRPDDNLYINGHKIILHLSERQMGDKIIVGHELLEELESGEQVLLNSNVLDYIFEHPELYPKHWKEDENGEIRVIYFWGSIFRNPSFGNLYVRLLYWSDGGLNWSYRWLGYYWLRRYPSASVASN